MLLQARKEDALPEMLIIAAGLSVPDPRERPEEQREAAATAHRAFADPDSDFLTLVNIWRAAPPLEPRPSANALRRFAKTHFLSLTRLREWRDIYRQLAEALGAPMRPPADEPPTRRCTAPSSPACSASSRCGRSATATKPPAIGW